MEKTFLGHLRINLTLFTFGAVAAYALPCTADPTPAPPTPPPAHHATINNYNPHLLPWTPEVQALHDRDEESIADYTLGCAALKAGKFVQAEADLRSSLIDEPKGETYLALGESLVGQGRISEALAAYNTVIHPPGNMGWGGSYMTRAHLEYAMLLNKAGQWPEALLSYRAAFPNLPKGDEMPRLDVSFDPDTPQPIALEAALHVALGLDANFTFQNERAFDEYTKALQLAPNWAAANYYYGFGWQSLSPTERAKLGSFQQAKAALQKAVKIGKGSVKTAAQKALQVAMKTK